MTKSLYRIVYIIKENCYMSEVRHLSWSIRLSFCVVCTTILLYVPLCTRYELLMFWLRKLIFYSKPSFDLLLILRFYNWDRNTVNIKVQLNSKIFRTIYKVFSHPSALNEIPKLTKNKTIYANFWALWCNN